MEAVSFEALTVETLGRRLGGLEALRARLGDDPSAWRVREVGLGATGAPETATTSFALQRTGASVARNELTSRRMCMRR